MRNAQGERRARKTLARRSTAKGHTFMHEDGTSHVAGLTYAARRNGARRRVENGEASASGLAADLVRRLDVATHAVRHKVLVEREARARLRTLHRVRQEALARAADTLAKTFPAKVASRRPLRVDCLGNVTEV